MLKRFYMYKENNDLYFNINITWRENKDLKTIEKVVRKSSRQDYNNIYIKLRNAEEMEYISKLKDKIKEKRRYIALETGICEVPFLNQDELNKLERIIISI